MTTFHVLNGDCLAEQLRQTAINRDFIICREALIDGNVQANSLDEFWKIRADFIANSYNASNEDYFDKSVKEFEKLTTLPQNSVVCLWFENDLFCQVNMWFVLSLLTKQPNLKIFRVFPVTENEELWKGFGYASTENLEKAYFSKVKFQEKDILLGVLLWEAYQNADFQNLKALSKNESGCFEHLEEVCQAHIDRFPSDNSLGTPEKVIKEIIQSKLIDFQEVFQRFSEKEGIYGFGDLQVRRIYEKLLNEI